MTLCWASLSGPSQSWTRAQQLQKKQYHESTRRLASSNCNFEPQNVYDRDRNHPKKYCVYQSTTICCSACLLCLSLQPMQSGMCLFLFSQSQSVACSLLGAVFSQFLSPPLLKTVNTERERLFSDSRSARHRRCSVENEMGGDRFAYCGLRLLHCNVRLLLPTHTRLLRSTIYICVDEIFLTFARGKRERARRFVMEI